MECEEDQVNEIEALKSIYPEYFRGTKINPII